MRQAMLYVPKAIIEHCQNYDTTDFLHLVGIQLAALNGRYYLFGHMLRTDSWLADTYLQKFLTTKQNILRKLT